MKRWIRTSCLVLALLMLLAIPTFAAEITGDEIPPAEIVLLLDCSSSLGVNDPKQLCLEACKSFVDTLPASKEVRVAVIAFGYRGGKYYSFESEYLVEYALDAPLIHVLVPLSDMSNSKDREKYKAIVESNVEERRMRLGIEDTFTPVATALASAVDVLETNGTSSGNGCIILISDGVDMPMAKLYDHNNATKRAGEKGYPIYCIELNYNNHNLGDVKKAQALMDEICCNSGQTDVGRITCETPTDVHVALQKIFCDFFELPWKDPVPVGKLPAEYTFSVPVLTSETTINVFGEGLEYVELVNEAGNYDWVIKKDVEEERLIAVVEEGSYYSIKMIVPAEGNWTLRMYGDEESEAQVSLLANDINLQEMELKMIATASSSAEELIKSDIITVNASFEYRGIAAHNSSFYEENPADVIVHCADGTTKEYTMEADSSGYKLQLPLNDLPSGKIAVQVALDHSMFRNDRKVSNGQTFQIKNLALELAGMESKTQSAFVNSQFERIDLSSIFHNPDGDQVEYTLNCASNRSMKFDYVVDSDYMQIQSGMVPGTYEVEIGATDPDMKNPLVYIMTLHVNDRVPDVKKMPKQKIWIDAYSWQKAEKMSATLNLDEYFNDPDGVQMTYTVTQSGSVAEMNQNGSQLDLLPVEKGEAIITVVGYDGVSEVSAEFEVDVVSGKAVYWQQNLIFYVIGLAILILIVILIIILIKNKRVKGEWDISVDENGNMFSLENTMNIANYTRVGKTGKFLLKDLLGELMLYIEGGNDLGLVLPDYFAGTGAERIELVGVMRKKGCTVNKIPNNNYVIVTTNGVAARNKVSVHSGSVTFTIEKADGSGDRLIISMFLR